MLRRHRPLMGVFLALAATVGGCALFQESPAQRAQRIEPMLSASGFHMLPADNEQRLSVIQSLPRLKMRYYTGKSGRVQYWFADPDFCNCIYIGDEAAYQRYQNLKIQEQIAQQAQMAAAEEEAAAEQMTMPGPFWWAY